MNKKSSKFITLFLAFFVFLTSCNSSVSSSSSAHEHTFATTWEYDDTYHWHPSICGHDVKGDEGRHEFTSETNENGDTVYTCSICHYSYSDGNNDDKDTYTITWKNYDGTILEIDNNVESGSMPTYGGEEPIKESDGRYNYTFAGWTPELEPVTKDATYTATFSGEEITYTVDFDLNGGTSSSYKGPIEVKTFSKDIFFFDCVKEDWQFRGWEYNSEKIFDEKGNQLKNVTLVDNMVFKAIYSQTVKLTITTNMPEAGTITGEGEYPYNTYVDVSVKPNQGYKFVGWYYQNTLLSNEEVYKYMMWDIDITLEARFEKDDFNLRIYTNNEDYGLVLLRSNSVIDDYLPEYTSLEEYTSEVTIAAYSKSDVRFLGWYDENNNLVTTNAVYTFLMPNYDYTLEAKWNYFTINYNLNGGVNNKNNVDHFDLEDSTINLFAPTKEGYAFEGWKYNEEFVDKIDTSVANNITLEAVWSSYEFETKEDNSGKYAVIIGYDDSITDVIIPENIILNGEEIPVKEISQTAFKGNQKVKSVTVSNRVKIIDEYAFAGCASLESIYLSDSVTIIRDYAFYDCSNLITVTIGENSKLFTIGDYALSGCSSLTSIYLPDSVTAIGSHAFFSCFNLTIYCEASSKPDGWDSSWNCSNRPVVWSSNEQYEEYSGLIYGVSIDSEGNPYIKITGYNGSNTDIVIPEYLEVNGEQIVVKTINYKAFHNNDIITSVAIPVSVTTIGDAAFIDCSSLTSIYIPSSVTTIGNLAFYDCSNLITVIIGENSQLNTIGDAAFTHCSSLTSIYIPSSVTSIGSDAFNGCSSLTSIYIPSGVTAIGDYAFCGCSNLITVTIGENSQLTTIGKYAFFSCSLLSSIYIPSGVTTIGDYAFYGCFYLITVIIGENSQLTTIGDYAFCGCSSLISIYIPDSVTTIGKYAFSNCSNLTIYCEASSKPSGWDSNWNDSNQPVEWSSNVQYEEYSGLIYCVSIDSEGNPYIKIIGYNGSNTDIVIPEYFEVNGEQIVVKTINYIAFYNNDTITSVTIPSSVTTIEQNAFSNCSNLATVTFDENSQLTTIGAAAFSDCSSLTSIYIPASVTTIERYAFSDCSNLTIYCETSFQPNGWQLYWNSSYRPVVWNVTYDDYLAAIV